MTSNVPITSPYLRTSRSFPVEADKLVVELNKSYVDIANNVNSRTISTFPTTRSIVNGEAWFLNNNQKQQGIRQVYQFTTTGNVPHGIDTRLISQFSKPSGSFTDGTNWYGAIYGSNIAIAGQVSFYITPTNIVVLAGAGAPTISKGIIVLEWLANV